MTHLPTRQIHLDFHTSPLTPDLSSEWDVNTFADTMKKAHVNLLMVFAKGHHGMSYYPTKIGQPHSVTGIHSCHQTRTYLMTRVCGPPYKR